MEIIYDVIIVGGSYAGLSAGMALGRSLKNVLIIDSGLPCNKQTPHAHNLLTHDGDSPLTIAQHAKAQVLQYKTVKFQKSLAVGVVSNNNSFTVRTWNGGNFTAKKILFATGVTDILPEIKGLAECWGISVLHCPYCHGYEFINTPTGILGNGDEAFEYAKLISNWTRDLTIYTNGPSALSNLQRVVLNQHNIKVNELNIREIWHKNGIMQDILFEDGSNVAITALYHRPVLKQHCNLPEQLGCEVNEHGFIKIDNMQQTTIPGVFAAGDNTTMFRSLAVAIADGSKAGAVINKQLIEERFKF